VILSRGFFHFDAYFPHGRDWVTRFPVDAIAIKSEKLLADNQELRLMKEELVPGRCSELDFWRRYYYAFMLLCEKEAQQKHQPRPQRD